MIDFFLYGNYHFNINVYFAASSYRKLFVNYILLFCLSVLALKEDPGTTAGLELYLITVNGFQLLATVVKSSVLNAAVSLDPSLNPFL